ncbi:MAG: T9SS type A sorting domain-containing protein [Bacteroidetes bacterium]|nr:T9SS type A sorting domain-containing protein [Bacteroidota bacterium]
MKQTVLFFGACLCASILFSCNSRGPINSEQGKISTQKNQTEKVEGEEGEEGYDEPAQAMKYDFDHEKDPKTNRVPRETLWPIIEYTEQLKQDIRASYPASAKGSLTGWIERGPNTDSTGPSNGNTRFGDGSTSGRIRAVMVDASDATGNTVFIGGVCGGIWKTTNISSTTPTWNLINDKLANLAVTGICQDPTSTSTMYFCTGESVYNGDAVQGDGLFKSTNGGTSWTQLSSTTGGGFDYCSRILCDASGNVYVGTRTGLYRSTNGGTSWTNITPSGISSDVADFKISSTGRLHLSTGLVFSSGTVYYRYTSSPSTATSSSGWSSATTPYSTSTKCRAVLACKGDTLLALPATYGSGYGVANVYLSTDGGDNWAVTSTTPSLGSQGWYCLAAAINPSPGTNMFMVGSLNGYRSTNGGSTWSTVTEWYNISGKSYVHADHQDMLWYNTSTQSRVIIVSDGGIFLSVDSGKNFVSKNDGLRLKQFYSVAINPSVTNYLLGGAQDNGCHALTVAGLSGSTEVTGGDGAYVHIDQNQPAYQFGSYTYNQYRVSTDGGGTWSQVNLNTSSGQFINPTDYDSGSNVMYCGDNAPSYRRWTNPQTGNTSATVSLSGLGSSDEVYAVAVSPYTSNKVLFGTSTGYLMSVSSANTTSSPAGTQIGSGLGIINSIVFGGSEDTVIVTSSSYSGTQVWYSTNATNSTPTWTAKDGNLPDMPVRWSLMLPNSYGKRVMLATETGVWVTRDITASSPTWVPDATFPNVRTDMFAFRLSDRVVAAATHGRGMWSGIADNNIAIALPVNNFKLSAIPGNPYVDFAWTFSTARDVIHFELQRSENASDYKTIATTDGGAAHNAYTGRDLRSNEGWRYYRVKSTDAYGLAQYTNVVSIAPESAASGPISRLYPNPAGANTLSFSLNLSKAADIHVQVYDAAGRLVLNQNGQAGAGISVQTLNISRLVAGNYLAIITAGSERSSQLFIRQ